MTYVYFFTLEHFLGLVMIFFVVTGFIKSASRPIHTMQCNILLWVYFFIGYGVNRVVPLKKKLYVECDIFYLTHDMWHGTCDICHVAGDRTQETAIYVYISFPLQFLDFFGIGATIRICQEIFCEPYLWAFLVIIQIQYILLVQAAIWLHQDKVFI